MEVTFTEHHFRPLPSPRDLQGFEREMIDRIIARDSTIGLPGLRQAQALRVVEECAECRTVIRRSAQSPLALIGVQARRQDGDSPAARWGIGFGAIALTPVIVGNVLGIALVT